MMNGTCCPATTGCNFLARAPSTRHLHRTARSRSPAAAQEQASHQQSQQQMRATHTAARPSLHRRSTGRCAEGSTTRPEPASEHPVRDLPSPLLRLRDDGPRTATPPGAATMAPAASRAAESAAAAQRANPRCSSGKSSGCWPPTQRRPRERWTLRTRARFQDSCRQLLRWLRCCPCPPRQLPPRMAAASTTTLRPHSPQRMLAPAPPLAAWARRASRR